MGGNVFPGLNRRYAKDEYLALVEELKPKFDMLFSVWNVTPTFESKDSFGDMDIIGVPRFAFNKDVLVAVLDIQLAGFLTGAKSQYPVKNNGGTWSVIYKEFQLDLVTCPEKEYEFTKNYMGVGDRGNFVGKIAHMLGLKFGHDGMWMVVRASDAHQLGEVLLTLDPKRAEEFLDIKPCVDPKTLEDIFENIAASKYFNPEVFLLENNNNVARVRDRKRPSYNAILEWCKHLPSREYFPRVKDKSIYLDMIFESFPEAKAEYDELWRQKEIQDKFKTMFNGDLVSEWTGYTGQELGKWMVIFKQHLRPEYVVKHMTAQDVENFVVFYNDEPA